MFQDHRELRFGIVPPGAVPQPPVFPDSSKEIKSSKLNTTEWGAVTRIQCKNGTELHLSHHPHANDFELRVLVGVGAHMDPSGRPGLSHFLEHYLLRFPHAELGAREVNSRLHQLQLRLNGSTGPLFTSYSVSGFRNSATAAIEQLDRGLFEAHFDQIAFTKESGVQRSERQRFIRETPYADLEQKIFGLLSKNPVNPLKVLPDESCLQQLTLDELASFWKANYHPMNTQIVYAGDCTEEITQALLATFGSRQNRFFALALNAGKQLIAEFGLRTQPNAQWSEVQALDVPQSGYDLGIVVPGLVRNHPNRGAQDLIVAAFNSPQYGWLWNALRQDLGLAYSPFLNFNDGDNSTNLSLCLPFAREDALLEGFRGLGKLIKELGTLQMHPEIFNGLRQEVLKSLCTFPAANADFAERSLRNCGQAIFPDFLARAIISTTAEQVQATARQLFSRAVVGVRGQHSTVLNQQVEEIMQELGWR